MLHQIESGIEIKKNGRSFLLRKLTETDLSEMLDLQQGIYDAIQDKSIFVFTSEEECSDSVKNDICLGIFEDGKMCAAAILVRNRESERNIASKLDLDCSEYVTLDSVFVTPKCRGMGFQQYLIEMMLDIAKAVSAGYAIATVSPDNVHSLANLQKCNFGILAKRPMYHGVERYILARQL